MVYDMAMADYPNSVHHVGFLFKKLVFDASVFDLPLFNPPLFLEYVVHPN